jgi:hypothetical protein
MSTEKIHEVLLYKDGIQTQKLRPYAGDLFATDVLLCVAIFCGIVVDRWTLLWHFTSSDMM